MSEAPGNEGFSAFRMFILESLKNLAGAVKEISETLVEVRMGISARNENIDSLLQDIRECRKELKDHAVQITQLQVKAGLWGAIGGAVIAAVVAKLIK